MRLATEGDLDGLRRVYERASLSNDRDRPFLEAHPELLVLDERGVREGRSMAATAGGAVVGFATVRVEPDHLELDALFVDPDHRRAGHAARLVAAVGDVAHQAGLGRVEVTANDHALAFYEAVGFEVVGTVETLFRPAPRMHLAV